MPLLPLSSLVSRQLCNAFPRSRPLSANGRFLVPNSVQLSARSQHMHMALKYKIIKHMKQDSEARSGLYKVVLKLGVVSVGLGLSFLAAPIIYCDPVTSRTAPPATVPPPSQGGAAPVQPSPPPPPPPASSVNFYELTFGTVCGICAGVFVKKGAKAVAFVMGGVFVLLQYLGSLSLVRVDWSRAATRFENLFYTRDATGAKRPPNVGSLFRWIIDFLTADFQQRASFVAGFALGLRIG
ncbi:FUN14 family-domain-containing protein [Trametes punicea]|nr:FUN14 family-domain-containing protein [Trametes punicea]